MSCRLLIYIHEPEVGWIFHPIFICWCIPQAGMVPGRNKNLCSSVFWVVKYTDPPNEEARCELVQCEIPRFRTQRISHRTRHIHLSTCRNEIAVWFTVSLLFLVNTFKYCLESIWNTQLRVLFPQWSGFIIILFFFFSPKIATRFSKVYR